MFGAAVVASLQAAVAVISADSLVDLSDDLTISGLFRLGITNRTLDVVRGLLNEYQSKLEISSCEVRPANEHGFATERHEEVKSTWNSRPEGRESRHVVQDAAVKGLAGYSTLQAPSIGLTSSQHQTATVFQANVPANARGTLQQEYVIAHNALIAAGVPPTVAKNRVDAAKA